MNFSSLKLPYQSTGFYSRLVTDYISQAQLLQPFYAFSPTTEGIKKAITARKNYSTNRKILVEVLTKQYAAVNTSSQVKNNIKALLSENTFTVTTAHQPNIFTGPLYFVYKILHAVKLAAECKNRMSENNFVPVYYMGSEDADLDELGHIFINGEKQQWQTDQTGAVGRMKVDKELIQLIDKMSGQLLIHPFGNVIIQLMKDCYKEGVTIEQASFHLVNCLFKDHGVLVVLPDNADLKRLYIPVVEKELTEAFSHQQVGLTVTAFPNEYKVQASGRELNLFYLKDNRRDRIEVEDSKYRVHDTGITFTKEEIIEELQQHPERFSANVILRPVFQETILPNIAFIGGGGEIAYWLELKKVFETVEVPYPVLVVRNSFMIVEKEQAEKIAKLKFTVADLFKKEQELINGLVKRESQLQLGLEKEQQALKDIYAKLKTISGAVDITLANHTEALQVKALQKIAALEKKMLRAEKRKFEVEQRQLHKLRTVLFPNNNLQERVENLMLFYAKWGDSFMQSLYQHSLALEQEFVVLSQD
jgi:bacillithiol biosynthesis cysteine-adding enzyme BshC